MKGTDALSNLRRLRAGGISVGLFSRPAVEGDGWACSLSLAGGGSLGYCPTIYRAAGTPRAAVLAAERALLAELAQRKKVSK